MEKTEISKKDNIKQAARQLFFQFGLTKTSMDDVARQCGLAKPSLYYYYPSKEAIFNEIVIDEARRFVEKIERKIPAPLPADQKMVFFLTTLYQDLKKYSRKLSHLPELMYENYPHGRPIVKEINGLFAEKLRPLLQEGQAEGMFSSEDPEIVLSAIVTMIHFLNLKWLRQIPDIQQDQIVEKVIDIILNGIRRKYSHAE